MIAIRTETIQTHYGNSELNQDSCIQPCMLTYRIDFIGKHIAKQLLLRRAEPFIEVKLPRDILLSTSDVHWLPIRLSLD